ncbi:hypothetical protein DX908_13270 [Parvularcula marina]|uniref:Polysaccharide chain length determinant N-terminal domain-containing protein n=2 Tax=Parvularcula marina TaxID=2292771 RepID=A0A371RL39_9PROT|nr:hypothetical protein DX908_13270 [Parvularcula marina]
MPFRRETMSVPGSHYDQGAGLYPSDPKGVDSVSLRDLIVIAAARFPLMLAVAAAVLVIGAGYVLTRSTVYRADTTIIVEPQTSGLLAAESAARGRAETEMMMRNQVEILQSRPVLQRVAEELSLVKEGGDMDEMIDRLQRRTRIRFQEGSGVITIIARTPNAELSANIANELADAYLAVQSEYRQSLEQSTSEQLAVRVAELAEDVREAEEALNTFQVENDLTDVAGNQSLTGLQLADLNRELAAARSSLTAATAKVNQARQLRQSGASLETLSDVLASPLISQLRQRQTDLNREAAQLRERLGPNHPDVIEMAAEQRELRSSINQQIGRFIQQLQNDVDVAQARVSTLEEQLAGIQGTFEEQSEKRIQLRELERNVQTRQEIYLATLSRLGQSAPGNDGLAPDARILSAAVPPTAPASTSKLVLLAFMIPFGLAAGYGVALAIEILTGSGFRSDMAISRHLGVPVLATVPSLRELNKNRETAVLVMSRRVIDNPRSPHSAAIRDVAALLKRPTDGNRRVVAITSTLPSEGATALSLSAGRALAEDGRKTVLVDADVLHPTVPRPSELKHEGPSLGDYLEGKAALPSITIKDLASPLHIIANLREVMIDAATAAEGVAALMEKLAGEYDNVIVKAPPLLSGRRTGPIYKAADDILLSVRWELTPRDAIVSALHHLGEDRAKLEGVVLFDVDERRHEVYTHGLLTRGILPKGFLGRAS